MMRTPLQKPEIEISLSASYPIIVDLGIHLIMHLMQLQVPIQSIGNFTKTARNTMICDGRFEPGI